MVVVYMRDTSQTAPQIISGTVSEFADVAKSTVTLSFLDRPFDEITGVSVASSTFMVDLAISPEDRVRGLSGRASLPPRTGLLFVFDKPDLYGIWMKDMKFPIDILWIDEELTVVHLEKNVSPQTYPKTFISTKPARFVLELPAGTVNNSNILVGATTTFLYQP